MIPIIIPTFRSPEEVAAQVSDLEGYIDLTTYSVHVTGLKTSAAKNRNRGLDIAGDAPIIIMLDDDIAGYSEGWADRMVKTLDNSDVIMVSARLTMRDGKAGPMMYMGNIVEPICDVPRVPTAAIAFRNLGCRFDEKFIGSGYEDDDFCAKLKEARPNGKFVINNQVKLIHFNEMKNQGGAIWNQNKAYFDSIWETKGTERVRRNPA